MRKPTRAIEISLDAWNQALFDELFPPVPELGCPTVLACDDETVRAAARRLGLPVLGGVSSLVQEIRLAHHINPRNGLKELMLIGSADSRGGGGEQDLAQPLLGRYLVVEAGHDQPGWEAVVYREELAVHPPATIARVRRGRLPLGSQP